MGDEAPPPLSDAAPVAEPPPAVSVSRSDVNRPLLFTHWKRPTFLQYRYLYDYRHNYYNDVIDYLDQRSRGYKPDIPVAQTWAERALRTYTDRYKLEAAQKKSRDIELLSSIRSSSNSYYYHSKSAVSRRVTTTTTYY